jgi:hypothetical protein
LWNGETGAHIRNIGEAGDFLFAVAASADGKIVVAGGQKGVARVFDGTTGQVLKTLVPPDG